MMLMRTNPTRVIAAARTLTAALLVFGGISLIGCSGSGHSPTSQGNQHAEEAAHPTEGPHHGALIELGNEEYHAEMLHDDAAHKVTIYLLDGAAKKSVAIADREITLNVVAAGKPTQFKLPAMPQVDDPSGQSSRFELANEALCEALDDPKTTGRLNVSIAGKSFTGNLTHNHHHDEHPKK